MEKSTPTKQTKEYRSAVAKINVWVKKNSSLLAIYENWYVGVTNNPNVRNKAHKNKNVEEPFFWLCIDTGSQGIALEVERYFHEKGMKDKRLTGGVKDNTTYVYVYKKHLPLIDYIL
ncbi:MAG: hypothetical protein WCO63_01170 [Bacteroidota bacterium]